MISWKEAKRITDLSTSLDKFLRTSTVLEQESLRQRVLYETPFSSLQQDLKNRRGLLEQITGSVGFSAMRALDSAAFKSAKSLIDLDLGVTQIRPSELGGLDSFVRAQAGWTQALSAGLESTTFGTLSKSISAGPDFSSLFPQLEVVLGSAALEFPETFGGLTGRLNEVARDIADGISRAAEGEGALAERSIRGFLTDLLQRYELVDEQGRAQILIMLAVFLISISGGAIGESLGGEWNRWRDAPAEAADQVMQASQAEELKRIRELAEHPPRQARVVRRAWLRSEPNAQSPKIGPVLEVETSLVVYERRDGWVRVEAESTPGDVRTGWVYGPLTQYE